MPLDNIYFDLNGISKHIGESRERNERNYGFGLTFEEEKELLKLLTVGYFKNSEGNTSAYAGGGLAKRFQLGGDYYADLGGVGGLATGYEKTISPIAMPMASIGLKDLWKLRFMYAPKHADESAVLMMNLGIPFR